MAKILLFVIEDSFGPGIRCLASYLEEHGHTPRLVFIGRNALSFFKKIPEEIDIDTTYKNTFLGFNLFNFLIAKEEVPLLPDSFLNFCKKENPDIIGFSTRFIEKRFEGFFEDLRWTLPNTLIIAGGHGPSVHTEEFLNMNLDCVIRGEGEEALLDLANAIDKGENYHNISNLAFKDSNGNIIKNRMNDPLDLSALPTPYRNNDNIFHVKDNIVYSGFFKDYNIYNNGLLAGRGCIGTCSYCAASLWREIYIAQGSIAPKFRRRTNAQIVEEALQMKQDGADGLVFVDDYFVRPYPEMLALLNEFQEKVKLPYYAHFSVEQFKQHPDLFQKAIDSGLTTLLLAQQTADEKFALEIFNRKNDNSAILEYFQKAFDQYVQIYASFIDGYLVEGRDDFEAKLEFIRSMPFDPSFYKGTLFNVFQLRIHPGSPLAHTWPTYKARLLSFKEFAYRAMLMHFRLIMTDDEFAKLREDSRYKENPRIMLAEFHASLKKKQRANLLRNAKKIRNQEVYFFGCGEMYQYAKNIFSKAKPRAILVDRKVDELFVDGLPVMQIEEALKAEERLPIVIFSSNALNIARKIKKMRPDYLREEIIACDRIPFD